MKVILYCNSIVKKVVQICVTEADASFQFLLYINPQKP